MFCNIISQFPILDQSSWFVLFYPISVVCISLVSPCKSCYFKNIRRFKNLLTSLYKFKKSLKIKLFLQFNFPISSHTLVCFLQLAHTVIVLINKFHKTIVVSSRTRVYQLKQKEKVWEEFRVIPKEEELHDKDGKREGLGAPGHPVSVLHLRSDFQCFLDLLGPSLIYKTVIGLD